jgi:hypothetical protein
MPVCRHSRERSRSKKPMAKYMNKEKQAPTQNQDFFTELYDTNDRATHKPRVISGGKITREQAAALGILQTTLLAS